MIVLLRFVRSVRGSNDSTSKRKPEKRNSGGRVGHDMVWAKGGLCDRRLEG